MCQSLRSFLFSKPHHKIPIRWVSKWALSKRRKLKVNVQPRNNNTVGSRLRRNTRDIVGEYHTAIGALCTFKAVPFHPLGLSILWPLDLGNTFGYRIWIRSKCVFIGFTTINVPWLIPTDGSISPRLGCLINSYPDGKIEIDYWCNLSYAPYFTSMKSLALERAHHLSCWIG